MIIFNILSRLSIKLYNERESSNKINSFAEIILLNLENEEFNHLY